MRLFRLSGTAALLLLVLRSAASAAVVYTTGFETYDAGDASEVGTPLPAYAAAYKRSGNVGMQIAAATSVQSSWFKDLTEVTAVTSYASARFYVNVDSSLSSGGSSVVGYFGQDTAGTTPGCVAVLKNNAGAYSIEVLYLGTLSAPISFGAVAAGGGWQDITLTQQNVDSDTVMCGLRSGNGQVRFETAQNLVGVTTAVIERLYLGTSASAVLPKSALTLKYDDVVVDDATPVSPGYVSPLQPAVQATEQWSSSPSTCGAGETSPQGCVNDWSDGVPYNSCTDPGTGNFRVKTTGTGTDSYFFTQISPALGPLDTIAAVRILSRVCNDHATGNGVVRHVLTISTVDHFGTEISMPPLLTGRWFQHVWILNPQTSSAWTSAAVNGLIAGHNARTNTSPDNGDPSVTAELIYVDIRTPSQLVDRTLLNRRGGTEIAIAAFGDSIIQGTGGSNCTAGTCTQSCTIADDCLSLGSGDPQLDPPACISGKCAVPCDSSVQCGNCGGQCPGANKFFRRACNENGQVDVCWNCAIGGSTSEDILADVTSCFPNPLACPSTCELVKGFAGTCSIATSTKCSDDDDCPGIETCNAYPIDYVVGLGGINNVSAVAPEPCDWNVAGTAGNWVNTTFYAEPTCPLAEVGATGFACERVACTTQADCTAAYNSTSRCLAACTGHTDPVWPCTANGGCSSCANNSNRVCINVPNACSIGGSVACNAGTCNTGGQKYCTCPDNVIACTVDADCKGTSGLSGACAGGFCTYNAASLWGVPSSNPTAWDTFQRRLVERGHGIDDIAADMQAVRTIVETAGATFVQSTNTVQMTNYGVLVGVASSDITMKRLRERQIAPDGAEYVLDLFWPAFCCQDQPNLVEVSTGSYLLKDRFHVDEPGAAVAARIVNGWLNSSVGVCNTDLDVPCQYCEVSCGSAADCDNGGTGESCVGSVCRCTTDADCGVDGTCGSISGILKCVVRDSSDCPVGNSFLARRLIPHNALCPSSGTCSEHASRPRCTRDGTTLCDTTADCSGKERSDVCSIDAVWIPCDHDGMCRQGRAGWANDVCLEDVCQRPAP